MKQCIRAIDFGKFEPHSDFFSILMQMRNSATLQSKNKCNSELSSLSENGKNFYSSDNKLEIAMMTWGRPNVHVGITMNPMMLAVCQYSCQILIENHVSQGTVRPNESSEWKIRFPIPENRETNPGILLKQNSHWHSGSFIWESLTPEFLPQISQ